MKHRLAIAALLIAGVTAQDCAAPARTTVVGAASTRTRVESLRASIRPILDAAHKAVEAAKCSDCREVHRDVWDKANSDIDAVAASMDKEIDAFVIRTVDLKAPGLTAAAIENVVRELLPRPLDEEPRVFLGSHRGEPYFIAVFAYFMNGGGSSVTVRAYKSTPRGLEVADVADHTMNGHANITARQIPAEESPGTWLLLSGNKINANGPRNRMRAYWFDGSRFRTVWMPADVWGRFEIAVDEHSFNVRGDYYKEGRRRDDTYAAGWGSIDQFFPIHK